MSNGVAGNVGGFAKHGLPLPYARSFIENIKALRTALAAAFAHLFANIMLSSVFIYFLLTHHLN
jgi:hypothetical protein